MTRANTIEIEGVGSVFMQKSRRARNFNLSFEADKTLRLAVPYWISFSEAKEAILSNTKWVHRYITKIKRLEEEHTFLAKSTTHFTRGQARSKLLRRTREIAQTYGYSYNRIFIRSQRTRWGSCSSKNNISLNIKLVKIPEELIDYVIVHELVHTRIKNHKIDFWNEIKVVLPNAKSLDLKLKKYQLMFL